MTLNLGMSLFPQADRDNVGSVAGIFEYDWVWNIGDRTALVSNGWVDPVSGGPRAVNFGASLGRIDGTQFYIGYRQIDPLESRAIHANAFYALSDKYRVSLYTTWDFGTDVQSYALGITRVGTDMSTTVSLGFNSVTRTTSVNFEIIPNLIRNQVKSGGGFGLAK